MTITYIMYKVED